MNATQLLKVTAGMKEEILSLLVNTNLANDKTAKRTIRSINNMFDELNLTIEDVIPEEVLVNYFGGVDEATKALSEAGVGPIGGLGAGMSKNGLVAGAFATRIHLNAVAEVTDDLILDLKAAIRTAKLNANKSISEALTSVKSDIQRGIIRGNTRKEMTKRVAESFNRQGMTSFITVDGKELPLDFYSEATVRTNLKKANNRGALARYEENGLTHVKVSGNTPTCSECYKYRNITFSLKDDGGEFPYLPKDTFPLHVNCMCSLQPFVLEYKTEEEMKVARKRSSGFDQNKDTRSESHKKAYERNQKRNAVRNEEKKQYARYKAILGDNAPKTLGGFRRSKSSNSDNFVQLKKDYREAMKDIRNKPF